MLANAIVDAFASGHVWAAREQTKIKTGEGVGSGKAMTHVPALSSSSSSSSVSSLLSSSVAVIMVGGGDVRCRANGVVLD